MLGCPMCDVPCTCQTTQRPTGNMTPPGELNLTVTHLQQNAPLEFGHFSRCAGHGECGTNVEQERIPPCKGGKAAPSKRLMPKATKVGTDGVVSPQNVFGMRF